MQSSSNLIVLLQSRATSENLWQPKLANGALHMTDFPLSGCGGLYPLRRLTADTTYHVGMSEGLGSSLNGFDIETRWDWLGDARMKRRGATRDNEGILSLVARTRPVASGRADEGRVISQRWAHIGGNMANIFNGMGYI